MRTITITKIMQDEINLANPIVDEDFDSLDKDNITQYCQHEYNENEMEIV